MPPSILPTSGAVLGGTVKGLGVNEDKPPKVKLYDEAGGAASGMGKRLLGKNPPPTSKTSLVRSSFILDGNLYELICSKGATGLAEPLEGSSLRGES
jgi:hypothetical protein